MSSNLNNHRLLPLPDELISYILEHTDYKAVIACRRSCRRLKDIVDDSSALQYVVELSAAGMCDGAPSTVGPAERLIRLQKAQTAWRTSSWSTVDHFPYSKEMSPFPVTASGNLVAFRSDRSRMGELLMLRFPSEFRGVPEQLWYLDLDCDRLVSICLDDTQDLLVFSSLTSIHIRTLSTGGVHPLTRTSGAIPFPPNSGGFYLHIHGDLLCSLESAHILVWNWKTGELRVEIPITTNASCCAFLDDKHIIFTHYNPARDRTMSFQVTIIPESGGTSTSPPSSYHFALNLPVITPPYFTELHVNTLLPSLPGSHRPGLFYADQRRKLFALELGAITVQGFTAVFTLHTLYVPHDALLSYIAAHPASSESALPSNVDVPWESWGPSHTRLVTVPNVAHSRYLGLHKVCGMHALSEPPVLFDSGILRIMDYHTSRARSPAAEQEDGAGAGLSPNTGSIDSLPADGTDTEEPREALGSSDDGTRANHRGPRRMSPPSSPPPPSPPPSPPDTSIPCIFKDIPLPKGLESDSVRCLLGEDVVVLFEVGTNHLVPALAGLLCGLPLSYAQFAGGSPEQPGQRIDRMYYHPI